MHENDKGELMNEQKLFLFDIDGTLIDTKEHIVPDSTKKSLVLLREQGQLLGISTGRSLQSVIESGLDTLIDWDVFLCNNGQAIYDKHKNVLHLECIPLASVLACIEKAERLNAPLLIMGEEQMITKEPDENVLVSLAFFKETIPKTLPYDGSDVIMMIAYGPHGYDYHDYAEIDGITPIPGLSNYADIVLKGFHKYIGIQFVLTHFDKTSYIAFGDSLNDMEMIKEATVGIAMGNAHDDLKAVADYISDDVLHDGIYTALKKLGFL